MQDTLSAKQSEAYQALQKIQPATNLDLSKWLQWPLNCVTGRITELRKQGLIREYDTITYAPTNRGHTRWITT